MKLEACFGFGHALPPKRQGFEEATKAVEHQAAKPGHCGSEEAEHFPPVRPGRNQPAPWAPESGVLEQVVELVYKQESVRPC